MIVADSDVLIDALRGHQPVADQIYRAIESRSLATTVINQFELLSGARTRREIEKVGQLLRPLPLMPLDAAASRLAAAIRVDLEKSGAPIGMADYLIAGICISRSLPLLTRNRTHFDRISELELV